MTRAGELGDDAEKVSRIGNRALRLGAAVFTGNARAITAALAAAISASGIDDEVTLKRFHSDKGQVRLEPANGEMRPIEVDPDSDAHILGVLVGVLRRC